ncbi:S8 family serine peptidase [Paractinoplanes rishiriensis]|uniref:Type VII secretion-associated serine protease n=1 Tax=Paractinoplanes rishiriensis TaxID=1050105 RepID=A0A919K3Y6_9ACTN|nr:S8 family serine peptidase [Actinoplanes rishiriensis]GIE99104.1 type VII secretion-associated serine protease [Actinoplanes rishiriensis]
MRIRRIASAAAALSIAAVSVPASPAFADSVRDRQWHLRSLNIAQTRPISTGSGVVVAVLDSGTYPHPDLRRNLLNGTDEIAGSGNGKVDSIGHGTNMASLIAAHGKTTNSGVQGIAPSAKILPVRISKVGKDIQPTTLASGIKWAADHDAKVINVSAGTGPDFALQDAVDAALDGDAVVVAASGNTSSDAVINFPAALDGVLAVGATGRNGKYSPISVKDPKVQICAPGVDITSAQPKDRYVTVSGTSESTAIVSGAVALVRAKFPDLSGPEVIERITSTADDIGPPGRDNECGFGLLNIVKALTADAPAGGTPTSAAASSAAATTAPATLPPTSATASDDGAEPASSATPLVLGGLAGLVVAGGLVAALAVRRRRRL